MILVAILTIIIIVAVTAYLITAESNKPERRYGRIIGISLLIILGIVITVGYMFITYFK